MAEGREAMGMRRMITSALAMCFVVLLPALAWAQEGSELAPPGGPEAVGGAGGSVGGTAGSAFTGAEIGILVTVALGLLAVGIATVISTRRRLRAPRPAA